MKDLDPGVGGKLMVKIQVAFLVVVRAENDPSQRLKFHVSSSILLLCTAVQGSTVVWHIDDQSWTGAD